MSHILKFRIWDNGTKRFIENSSGTHCYSNWYIDAFTGKPADFVGTYDDVNYSISPDPKWYVDNFKVIKEPRYIVQQFIGLTDKNNVEIYEGDIIKQNSKESTTCVVIFDKGMFLNKISSQDIRCFEDIRYIEVIGNIFQKA